MLEKYFRNLVIHRLSKIRNGFVSVNYGNEKLAFGDRQADLQVEAKIHDPQFFQRLALGGDIGAAESFVEGEWDCSDIAALIRVFARNLKLADRMNRGIGRTQSSARRITNRLRRNSQKRSRQNIHEHYDLGNDFFATFLDPTLNYSSGIFQQKDDSMFLASLNKMWRICKKLDLQPNDHLLEIGTGWGGLSIFAARHFGCKVTTTTISEEQYLLAKQRVNKAGLSDKINVVKKDYRELTGSFDKLVSIEMIEAVGYQFFDKFFAKCKELLNESGRMLIQSIVTRDARFQSHKSNYDFIKKYIFPGGCLPSNEALLSAMTRSADFMVLNLEDIGLHYAQTLRLWRNQFEARLNEIREIGLADPRFHRLWRYYLGYCEAGFQERQISNIQLLVGNAQCVSSVSPGEWELSRDQLLKLAVDWETLEEEVSAVCRAPKMQPSLSRRTPTSTAS